MNILTLFCLVAFILIVSTVQPPNYNYSYRVVFDETFIKNGSKYEVNGQLFYDPLKNRQRVDRTNGRYDIFCGSVFPDVTTSCQHYTTNNKRFLVFPQKSQCCFCCSGEKGCGILKPDWLKDAVYKNK